jgi:phage gp16-like protein
MTETAQQLRERAARLRKMAQYADGQAYHREMQEVQHLINKAKEIEAKQAADKFTQAAEKRKAARRKKDLARIHLLKKDLGLDDDSYRDMLEKLTGKRSAGKLTGPERNKVVLYMNRNQRRRDYPGRPNNTDSNAQLKKIEALLAEAKRPWEYARAIAEHMHGKKRLEFCDSAELSGVITALIKDAERHGRLNAPGNSRTPAITGGRRTS